MSQQSIEKDSVERSRSTFSIITGDFFEPLVRSVKSAASHLKLTVVLVNLYLIVSILKTLMFDFHL